MMRVTTRAASRLPALLSGCVLLAGLSCLSVAQAQSVRDPTLRPATASSAPAGGSAGRAPAPEATAVAVIVRDGQPYLVVGTRLVAQGQMLGEARIERITETEVWLREGKAVRKLPVFGGIVRRAAATSTAPRNCAAPDAKKRPVARALSPTDTCPP